MKFNIFTYEGFKDTNIGDYIQSLAARQFLDKENIAYIHRDKLNDVNYESKVIMNGWFSHYPENWPPSDKIYPLFVSFHINSAVYDTLLSDKSIEYFKKFEPIGCRDKTTVEKLQEKGVNAYFSSCLTTTLGYKYHSSKKSDTIYVVDAVHYIPESQRRLQKYKFVLLYLLNMKGVNRFIRSIRTDGIYKVNISPKYYDRFCRIVRSYLVVKKLLSKEDLKHVQVLSQFYSADEIPTNEARFQKAEVFLRKYAEARLVITSRIHVALPCTGLETPVVFLQNMDDSIESTCRFKGLLDLLNVVKIQKNKILESPFNLPFNIESIRNPNTFRNFANDLIKKCLDFIQLK